MSVEKRDDRWLARWREDGRQRARTFDRKADAEAFERERRRQAALGAHGPAEPSPLRLGEWLEHWWDGGSHHWAPSTRRQRASVLDRWVVPYMEGARLRDLGVARVRQWQTAILKDECTPTQANHALSILSAALGVAVDEGLLPVNPCARVRKLPVAPTRPLALAPEQVERLRAEMPTLRDVALLGLLAYAGLRPGEALALTWGSVGRVLVIDRSVSDGVIRQTKTNERRTVEVVEPLAEDLDLHRPKVARDDELVCASGRGTVLNLGNWRERVWWPACERAGLSATPYDGRHSYASGLIHEGRSLPYVTAAMGHASATTTLRHYAHVFEEARLGTGVEFVDAIRSARAELERSGVYPVCTRQPVRTLRTAL